jgi:hypothetical protein
VDLREIVAARCLPDGEGPSDDAGDEPEADEDVDELAQERDVHRVDDA